MRTFELDLSPQPGAGTVSLTAYLHSPSPEFPNMNKRPAVIVLPGGAYRICADREGEPVAMIFASHGFQAFVLRYSVGKNAKFPQPLLDAEKALEVIRENARDWLIDPEKIAVCGFSAGGHLAACLGTSGKIRPNALVLGYPALPGGGELPNPIEMADSDTPPCFIVHTWEDPLIPVTGSLAFAQALSANKIPFEMHVFQWGQHAMSTGLELSSGGVVEYVNHDFAQWMPLSAKWLFNTFGHFETPKKQFAYLTASQAGAFNLDVEIGSLLKYPEAREVVLRYLPEIENHRMAGMVKRYHLAKYSEFDPAGLPPDALAKLGAELEKIPFTQPMD